MIFLTAIMFENFENQLLTLSCQFFPKVRTTMINVIVGLFVFCTLLMGF